MSNELHNVAFVAIFPGRLHFLTDGDVVATHRQEPFLLAT